MEFNIKYGKLGLKNEKTSKYFGENNDDLKDYLISSQDWELVSRIFTYLKVFKTLSDSFQGEKYCSLPMGVLGINMLLDKLENWTFELDNCPNRKTTDEQVIEALQAARDKIVKHYSKTNWIYCVALILDPRHKTETFNFTNWGKDLKAQAISKLENLYKEIYYITSTNEISSTSHDTDTDENNDEFNLQSLFVKSNGNQEQNWRKEIDEYCMSKRAEGNQDILEWWRKNEAIYPNLSKMARDFLSIQATSVPAERLFSRPTLTVTKERSRLTGESARFLLCLNSWLCNKDIFLKE